MSVQLEILVEVYRNLNKKGPQGEQVWSVRHAGKVIAHTSEITLKDVKFHVGEGARQRVLREKRKNVHAWAKGTVTLTPPAGGVPVSYCPYRGPTFYAKNSGDPVLTAKILTLGPRGCTAHGVAG